MNFTIKRKLLFICLMLIIYGNTAMADLEIKEVNFIVGIKVDGLSDPLNLTYVVMKSLDGCYIQGEAGIRPIDSRVLVRLRKQICGDESVSIEGRIVDLDGYEGMRVECVNSYFSSNSRKKICLIGKINTGRRANALITKILSNNDL